MHFMGKKDTIFFLTEAPLKKLERLSTESLLSLSNIWPTISVNKKLSKHWAKMLPLWNLSLFR